ncbi:MAG: ECF-type sigma factor [Candidatus Paceibacterota bacterium]
MCSDGSVTTWLMRVGQGDPAAELWLVSNYFERIARMARRQLGAAPRRAADEEDVANSVFKVFLDRAKNGGFQQLNNRDDLHRVLLMLTRRKAIDYYRRAHARTRREVGESALTGAGTDTVRFEDIAVADAPRDLVGEISAEIRELFDDIRCRDLRLDEIAMWRLEGFSVAEIAARLGCLPRTVYRRLNMIQQRWESRVTSGDEPH